MKRRGKALLIGLACGLSALAVSAAAMRIETLLPPEGASRCFAGDFDGSTGLTFGYPQEKRSEEAHATRFVLRLDREPGQEPHRDPTSPYQFDWRYDFRLVLETSDKGQFRSAGQCDWRVSALSHVEPDLFCFIDCDGGGIRLTRTLARSAIDMEWDAEGWLRMSSCGGGGEILRGGNSTKSFRLGTAPGEICKNLPDYSY